jgi:hypothetical protein
LSIFCNKNYNERLQISVGEIDSIIDKLIHYERIWGISVFEPFEDDFVEKKKIEYLISKKTRLFANILVEEEKVYVLINSNDLNKDIYQEVKNIAEQK